MEINGIVAAIHSNRVRVTDHADEEAQADRLTLDDIFLSILHGKIIELYESDKPYQSCKILGKTDGGLVVHSVRECNLARPVAATNWAEWGVRHKCEHLWAAFFCGLCLDVYDTR